MKKVSSKSIIKLIDKYEYVSFDIFDTLIKRNCLTPTDIFEICENIYNSKNKDKIKNFKFERIEAERKCREKKITEEIHLNEIYDFIACKNLDKKKMMDIEIDTEKKYCVANEEIKKVYDYCAETNKSILFISDMYLDEKVIKDILVKNGYIKGKLYLSSTYNTTKHSGNLFKLVLKKEKISPKQLVHIGDSKRADFLNPFLLHIKAIKINREEINTLYLKPLNANINSKVLFNFINNNVNGMNEFERIGYELLGPICYSFCNWVHSTAVKNNIEKLYFCSRDMNIVFNAYNIIYADSAIYNKYMHVSRKSLRLPYFYKNNSYKDFFEMIPDKKMKMSDILKNFNLEIDESLLNEYGYKEGDYNCYSLNNKNFKDFYISVLKKELDSNLEIKIQYNNFINYLKLIGFDINSAIVDLGWKGTTQYSIQKILKRDIKGLYFGIEKRAFKELNNNNSYAFAFNKSDNGIEEKIYSFRSLFEILFASFEGSTLKYSNNKDVPYVLGECENFENNVLTQIQSSAMKFIKDFKEYNINIGEIREILDEFINIGINPTLSEAQTFGDLNFENMVSGKLAKPNSIFYYIIHLRDLKRDIFLSEWKIGFLKRLLRVKLPYYKVYNILRGRKKNYDGKVKK